jgi:hypothetical protein
MKRQLRLGYMAAAIWPGENSKERRTGRLSSGSHETFTSAAPLGHGGFWEGERERSNAPSLPFAYATSRQRSRSRFAP